MSVELQDGLAGQDQRLGCSCAEILILMWTTVALQSATPLTQPGGTDNRIMLIQNNVIVSHIHYQTVLPHPLLCLHLWLKIIYIQSEITGNRVVLPPLW